MFLWETSIILLAQLQDFWGELLVLWLSATVVIVHKIFFFQSIDLQFAPFFKLLSKPAWKYPHGKQIIVLNTH